MFKKLKTLYLSFLFIIIFLNSAFSDVINSYIINGNKRISDDTILMFSQIEKNQSEAGIWRIYGFGAHVLYQR